MAAPLAPIAAAGARAIGARVAGGMAGRTAGRAAGSRMAGSKGPIKSAGYAKQLDYLKAQARQAAIDEMTAKGESTSSGVSAFDVDFILMMIIAVTFDILDIILEVLSMLGAGTPKAITIIIDLCLTLFIGGWIYWRTSKIIQTKQQFIQTKLRQFGKAETAFKHLAKTGKPLFKTVLRCGIAFLGEVCDILVLGLFPFWTITVFMTLREKG